jgi:transcription initiation factor TFIID TATA-box-binding protein
MNDAARPPKIQNVVVTCNVGSTLYLPSIAKNVPGSEYNVRRFAAVTSRLREPRTTALFFGSGKVVCTGASSVNAARLSLLKFVRILRRIGLVVNMNQFRVQNVVASAGLGYQLKLGALLQKCGVYASYEPALFPGLVYRPADTPIVFLLFRSGRVVITGAKTTSQVVERYAILLAFIESVREQVERTDAVPVPVTPIRPECTEEWLGLQSV